MCGIFETKNLTKEQKRKYKRTASEIRKEFKNYPQNCKCVRSDIVEKIIENCRGVKKSNDGINRLDKEKQRENFRQLFGFKENEIYESKEYSVVKRIKEIFKRPV